MKWIDRNFCKHPQDPDYDHDYDPEEDYERYVDACEEREDARREK